MGYEFGGDFLDWEGVGRRVAQALLIPPCETHFGVECGIPQREAKMVYFKSVIAGLIAIIGAVILMVVVVTAFLGFLSRDLPAGETYAWDPISIGRSSLIPWVFLLVVFMLGFAWEYRRAIAGR